MRWDDVRVGAAMSSRYVIAIVAGFAVAFVVGFGLSALDAVTHRSSGISPMVLGATLGMLTGVGLANLAGNRKVRTAGSDVVAEALAMRPPAGQALVYVYREGVVGKAVGMNLVFDGRPAAQLTSPRFTCFAVAPGRHLLEAGFGGPAARQSKGVGVELNAVEGGVHVFRCAVALGALKNTVKMEPVVDLARARSAMGGMKMTAPELAPA